MTSPRFRPAQAERRGWRHCRAPRVRARWRRWAGTGCACCRCRGRSGSPSRRRWAARAPGCAAGCPCSPASASPAPTWAASTSGRASCPGTTLPSSSGASPASWWCPASRPSACCSGGSSRASRHIPALADGLQAGGHFPRGAAAPAADHDPFPGPADAAVHGLPLRPGGRAEGGSSASRLGALPHGHALAAEPGDRAADGGAGVPGLHAAHAGALHGAGPRRAHLPALLRGCPLPPHLRAAPLPPAQRGDHLPVGSLPVLLHGGLRRLHRFPLHPHRTPDRAGPLPLLLQLHGLPRRLGGPGAPAAAAPAGRLRAGRGPLPAAAAAAHGPAAVRQPPPVRAAAAGGRPRGAAVLLTPLRPPDAPEPPAAAAARAAGEAQADPRSQEFL